MMCLTYSLSNCSQARLYVVRVEGAITAFISKSMSSKSCMGETSLVLCKDSSEPEVQVSETLLPVTEKEDQPSGFVCLLCVYT